MSTTTTYAYDKSGRMTKQYSPTDAHYFTYNERNMITQIQDVRASGSGTADTNRYFTYNGLKERVFGIDGTTTPSYWTYDGRKLLNERQGSLVVRYRHNDTDEDCPYGSCIEREDEVGTLLSPVFDGNGSTQQMYSASSGVASYEYNKFGQSLASGSVGLEEQLPNRLEFATVSQMTLATTEQIDVGRNGTMYLPASASSGYKPMQWPDDDDDLECDCDDCDDDDGGCDDWDDFEYLRRRYDDDALLCSEDTCEPKSIEPKDNGDMENPVSGKTYRDAGDRGKPYLKLGQLKIPTAAGDFSLGVFTFQVNVEVTGDCDKCTYQQWIRGTVKFEALTGDEEKRIGKPGGKSADGTKDANDLNPENKGFYDPRATKPDSLKAPQTDGYELDAQYHPDPWPDLAKDAWWSTDKTHAHWTDSVQNTSPRAGDFSHLDFRALVIGKKTHMTRTYHLKIDATGGSKATAGPLTVDAATPAVPNDA